MHAATDIIPPDEDRVTFTDLVANKRVSADPSANVVSDPGAAYARWTASAANRAALAATKPRSQLVPAVRLPGWVFDAGDIDTHTLFKHVSQYFRQFGFLDTSTCATFSTEVILCNASWVDDRQAPGKNVAT
jgi:hypothetical protein